MIFVYESAFGEFRLKTAIKSSIYIDYNGKLIL